MDTRLCVGSKVAAVLCSALLLPTSALAGGKKIKQADVPKPVMATLTAKYREAKWKAFALESDGRTAVYEAEFTQGKDEISVDVSGDGKVMAEETVMPAAELPATVKQGIEGSKYNRWKTLKAERVITEERSDAPSYEVMLESKNQRIELLLDKDGRITKETPKGKKDVD
jgi:uncharacterized membrane protein YkoI